MIRILFLCCLLILSLVSSSQNVLFNSSGGTPDVSALMELRSTDQGFLTPRMLEVNRLAINSPAQGLLVFQSNGTVGFYFYNGSGWDTLGGATTVTNISNVTNVTSSGIAVIRDEKASSTDGGTFTSGSWQQRDLNSLTGDVSFVSLGTNDFTLDSGIYVITATAPAYDVQDHQARIYNSTSALSVAVGSMGFSNANGGAGANTESNLVTVVQVGASGETFRIEHRCSATVTTDGFGIGAPWGVSVFTQVKIEKL